MACTIILPFRNIKNCYFSKPKFKRLKRQISFPSKNQTVKRYLWTTFDQFITQVPSSMSVEPATQPPKTIIPNNNGEKLVGLLHDTRSKEVGVLCHGFTGTKEDRTMVTLALALEKEGISAFRFDFSGNGESDGAFSFSNYMREVEDLQAVVNHFHGANHIVSAIIGHSKGADDVLLYASKYHDVRTIVNLSGRYDLKKGITEKLGEEYMERIKKDGHVDIMCIKTGNLLCHVTQEALMDRLNTDIHEACLKIDKDCRVLTVHGSADEVIPVEDAHAISRVVPNHQLHVIEGANHCYTEHQAEVASVAVDFIKACVQQDRETSG